VPPFPTRVKQFPKLWVEKNTVLSCIVPHDGQVDTSDSLQIPTGIHSSNLIANCKTNNLQILLMYFLTLVKV